MSECYKNELLYMRLSDVFCDSVKNRRKDVIPNKFVNKLCKSKCRVHVKPAFTG